MPQDDPHYQSAYWRALRQQVFERDDWRCVLCDSPEDLECHHRTYVRKGKELLRDCYTLCVACHDVVTDHQRRQRFATRQLPPVPEVRDAVVVAVFGSAYKEVSFETNSEIPSDRRGAPLDAQWATGRPTESVGEGNQNHHGQAEENGGRPRGDRAPRMDGKPLSERWGTVHSSRRAQGDLAAGSHDAEEGSEGEGRSGV